MAGILIAVSTVPAACTGGERHLRYVDVRPYTVPEVLEQLAGPDCGEVQPPTALTGAPRRSYRLDVEHDAELLYRTVIREASTIDDLARIGLAATQGYGFALAGGYALAAHGLVDRATEDVDLFTNHLDPVDPG